MDAAARRASGATVHCIHSQLAACRRLMLVSAGRTRRFLICVSAPPAGPAWWLPPPLVDAAGYAGVGKVCLHASRTSITAGTGLM